MTLGQYGGLSDWFRVNRGTVLAKKTWGNLEVSGEAFFVL